MLTYIFILGLLIISWPFLGGFIGTFFSWIVLGLSLPFYWFMRLFKHSGTPAEDEKLSKISSGISMVIVVAALFFLLIHLSL